MLDSSMFSKDPCAWQFIADCEGYWAVLKNLSIYLIEIRKIPKVYFREAAKEHGISPDQLSDTHLKQVIKSCPKNRNRAHALLLVMLLVEQRLQRYPDPLTFPDAVEKVGQTLTEMTKSGYTIHALSEKLGINYGSLKNLHDGKSSRPRECPWALKADLLHLQKLDQLHAAGKSKIDLPVEDQEALKEATDRKLRRLRLKKEFVIYPFDSCASCQAPWKMLNRKGENDDTVIMQCTVCDCENLVDTGEGNRLDDANTHEIIDPGNPCWMCSAGHAELEFHGIDNFKMDVYSCRQCNSTNRVAREGFLSRADEEEMDYGHFAR